MCPQSDDGDGTAQYEAPHHGMPLTGLVRLGGLAFAVAVRSGGDDSVGEIT